INFRIDASTNLIRWDFLTTLRSAGSIQHTDSAAPFLVSRFYRAVQVPETNAVTGDHLATDAGDILIHPINHATFIMVWNGKTIYSDPVGGAARFQGLPRADLILVTHTHSDHFDAPTINAVRATNAVIIAPAAVFQSLSATLKNITGTLANGDTTNLLGISIEAVPMYNLTSSFHLKGAGNGYVLAIGGRRIYISGDTEDIDEMRALRGIDVAFVCMNLPFTMPVDKAANAVREFRPGVVYPYHFQGSDVNKFKQLVGTNLAIEVRLRKWY
ncbi:MAG: MBL fold metallo-hydrolase, partial [Verrucomicrobiota bacterium]